MSQSANDRLSLVKQIRVQCASGVLSAGLLLVIVSFLILAAQFIWYLKDGIWPYWVLAPFVLYVTPSPFQLWLTNPQDWHGLHTIVVFILALCP